MNEMSYRMLIKNKDKSIDFVIVNGNKIMGENYSKNGVRKSDLEYINYIQSKIFYNDNCEYIETNGEYEVYYDKETGIKHFLKNKKESLELLIKYNGVDGIRYLKPDTKNRILSTILLLEVAVAICVGESLLIQNKIVAGPDLNSNYDYDLNIAVNYYGFASGGLKIHEPLDYKGALRYIQESSLDEHTKEILSNEELLQDMFAYYKGTLLEYSATNKFEEIHISYFEEDKSRKILRNGFYNCLYPNEINVETNVTSKYDEVVAHEYLHLFQAEGLEYHYLLEASAELCSAEYYNYKPGPYLSAINNLKLLMDIIGPEPIIKLLFSGDDDDFLRIIRTNLPKEQSNRLLALLNTNSENQTDEVHNEIRELLCKLYKALNGRDIQDDPDIMYDLIYENDHNNRGNSMYQHSAIYFNVREMPEVEKYNSYKVEPEPLVGKGLIKPITYYSANRNIFDWDEYEKLAGDNTVSIYAGNSITLDGYVYGALDYENECFYLFDNPLGDGEYSVSEFKIEYDKTKVTGKSIPILEAFKRGYLYLLAQKVLSENEVIDDTWFITERTKYVSTNPNIEIKNGDENNLLLNFSRPGLKARFKEQYENLSKYLNIYEKDSGKALS